MKLFGYTALRKVLHIPPPRGFVLTDIEPISLVNATAVRADLTYLVALEGVVVREANAGISSSVEVWYKTIHILY
mgnify:CR=1 FL=1